MNPVNNNSNDLFVFQDGSWRPKQKEVNLIRPDPVKPDPQLVKDYQNIINQVLAEKNHAEKNMQNILPCYRLYRRARQDNVPQEQCLAILQVFQGAHTGLGYTFASLLADIDCALSVDVKNPNRQPRLQNALEKAKPLVTMLVSHLIKEYNIKEYKEQTDNAIKKSNEQRDNALLECLLDRLSIPEFNKNLAFALKEGNEAIIKVLLTNKMKLVDGYEFNFLFYTQSAKKIPVYRVNDCLLTFAKKHLKCEDPSKKQLVNLLKSFGANLNVGSKQSLFFQAKASALDLKAKPSAQDLEAKASDLEMIRALAEVEPELIQHIPSLLNEHSKVKITKIRKELLLNIIDVLIDAIPDDAKPGINAVVDEQGHNCLYYAVVAQSSALIQKLLEKGANPSLGTPTPFGYLMNLPSPEFPKEWVPKLMQGVNIMDYLCSDRDSTWKPFTASQLVKWGADVNGCTADKTASLLSWAIENTDDTEFVKMLLEKKADPNFNEGLPLHQAVSKCHDEWVELLIGSGADVNLSSPIIKALWMIPKSRENSKSSESLNRIISLLIGKKVDVNVQDRSGNTPLNYAVLNCEKELIKKILEIGADVNFGNIDSKMLKPYELAISQFLGTGGGKVDQKYLELLPLIAQGANIVDGFDTFLSVPHDNGDQINWLEYMQNMIEWGADVNALGKDGLSLLNLAFRYDSLGLPFASFLIKKKADVNFGKPSPLNAALNKLGVGLRTNKMDLSEIYRWETFIFQLLDAGADVNLMDNDHNALHFAAAGGVSPKIVEALLEKGTDLKAGTNQPCGVALDLWNTTKSSKYRALAILMMKGANVVRYFYPTADASPKSEEVKEFVDSGADINAVDHDNASLLIHAYGQEKPDMELVKFLMEKGADIHQQDNSHRNLLAMAFAKKDEEMIRLLISKKASVVDLLQYHSTYIDLFQNRQLSFIEKIDLLISLKADLKASGQERESLLTYAIQHIGKDSIDIPSIKYLIEKGADVKACNKGGVNPLYFCINSLFSESDTIDLMSFMIKHGADINVKCPANATTFLHQAAFLGQTSVVSFLVENKVDVNVLNAAGFPPIVAACKQKKEETAIELLKLGANLFATDNNTYNAIHWSLYHKLNTFNRLAFEKLGLTPLPEKLQDQLAKDSLQWLCLFDSNPKDVYNLVKAGEVINPVELFFAVGALNCFQQIAGAYPQKEILDGIGKFIEKYPSIDFSHILNLLAAIDRNHLKTSEIEIEAPDIHHEVKIEKLVTLFDEINFTDPSDKSTYRDPKNLTNEGKPVSVAQLRVALNNLICNVRLEKPYLGTPPAGTPELKAYYATLHKYLRHLTVMIPLIEDKGTRADHLVTLGFAALWCGTRWIGDAVNMYEEIKRGGLPLPFDQQYLLALQKVRKEILIKMSGGNVHHANDFFKLVGQALGISGTGGFAQITDPTMKDHIKPEKILMHFWLDYTLNCIYETTKDFLHHVDVGLVVEWFKTNMPKDWEKERYDLLFTHLKKIQDNSELDEIAKKAAIVQFFKSKGLFWGNRDKTPPEKVISDYQQEEFLGRCMRLDDDGEPTGEVKDTATLHFAVEQGVFQEPSKGIVEQAKEIHETRQAESKKRKAETSLDPRDTKKQK